MSGRAPNDDAELPPWAVPRYRVAESATEVKAFVQAARGDRAIGVWIDDDPDAPLLAVAREHDCVTDGGPTVLVTHAARGPGHMAELLAGDAGPYVVFHDAQAAMTWLAGHEVAPARYGSTVIAAVLLSEGTARGDVSLEECCARALGRSLPVPPALRNASAAEQEAATHADVVLASMAQLTPMLRKRKLTRVYDLECRLLPAVIDMERAGVAVDAARFQRIADAWARERSETTDPARITRLDKLTSTYGYWAREFVDLDGRIRCHLHPLTADSGRFSCTDPNLQQVPSKRTAPGLRECFVPADGCVFVIADYAQIELRVAAQLAPDDVLREVFRAGGDPHRTTAASIAGKPPEDITAHERKLAKAVNFGFLFGMGARRFQSYAADGYGTDLSQDEARRAREAFFDTFPGIKRWHARIATLGRRGERESVVVRTALGRRKRFDAGKFSYNAALNIPVQGTAAEGFKLAMIALHERLPALGGRGVLCIHDEYIAEVPRDRAEEGRALIERTMIEGMREVVDTVPIEVEARIAENWG